MKKKEFRIEEIKEEKARFLANVFSAGMVVIGAIIPIQVLWYFGLAAPRLLLAFTALSIAFALLYVLEAKEAYIRRKVIEEEILN